MESSRLNRKYVTIAVNEHVFRGIAEQQTFEAGAPHRAENYQLGMDLFRQVHNPLSGSAPQ